VERNAKLKENIGWKITKILCNKFGFSKLRQKGSHVSVAKDTPFGKVGTVIPMHPELKIGTLKAILKQARISEEEIVDFLWLVSQIFHEGGERIYSIALSIGFYIQEINILRG
jgi:predicted RNA binding protein YcfA (HicA-like mRNA interferase family)